MSHFDFKQFRICHDRCAMKVGTDGVLLGAWANIKDHERVLDIGTGTGLIAIMLAQRATAQLTGIEIDPNAAEQAKENVHNCPFSEQIEIVQSDIKNFTISEKFDNIVSNPPFYQEEVLPPSQSRATARHTQGLSLEELANEVKRLLKPNGIFQVILPFSIVSKFIGICALREFSLIRRTDIRTKENKPYKRTLLCFINNIAATQPLRETLTLSNSPGERSEAYIQLTKDFYLEK